MALVASHEWPSRPPGRRDYNLDKPSQPVGLVPCPDLGAGQPGAGPSEGAVKAAIAAIRFVDYELCEGRTPEELAAIVTAIYEALKDRGSNLA